MNEIVNYIENDESTRKAFTVGFIKLTKIHIPLDVSEMVEYLEKVFHFPPSMIIGLCVATHTSNSIIIKAPSGRYLTYRI